MYAKYVDCTRIVLKCIYYTHAKNPYIFTYRMWICKLAHIDFSIPAPPLQEPQVDDGFVFQSGLLFVSLPVLLFSTMGLLSILRLES